MSESDDRQNDIMLMILGLQLSVLGAVIEQLLFLLPTGAVFTFLVYTNELRRRW